MSSFFFTLSYFYMIKKPKSFFRYNKIKEMSGNRSFPGLMGIPASQVSGPTPEQASKSADSNLASQREGPDHSGCGFKSRGPQ